MTRPDDDPEIPEIAAAFSALRREEEASCPPFADVWRRARKRVPRSAARRRAWIAATTAAAVAVALLAAWIGLRTPPQPIPSIAAWRSPTAFLLETPGREVLAAPSGLHRSILDVPPSNQGRDPS
jgi:hypothetical protein